MLFGGILLKDTKKIGVLISLILISIIAIGAVSAADDVAVDDADVAAVEEVAVDDAPASDEIDYGSNDIIVADTGDSSDSTDSDVITSDSTGLQDESGNGDDAVADVASPKNALKAEPLRAEDDPHSFSELWGLIQNGGTIDLQYDYVYDANADGATYQDGEGWFAETRYYRDGLYIDETTTINGNGHYISGNDLVRIFDVYASTLTLNNLTLKNGNSVNSQTYGQNRYGGAIYSHGNGATVIIDYCNLTDNHADGNSYRYSGGAIYSTGTCNITNSILVNNSAFNGGVFTSSGSINIHGCVIFDNTATNSSSSSPTFGDNGFLSGGSRDLEYNWWGSNKGPENTIATTTVGTSASIHDWFILTETLSSVTTVDVDFELYRGGTCEYTIPVRNITVSTDADTCNTTSEFCPGPFTIEFTTSNDAYINVSTDHEQQHLKVFAGENKKNITYLYVEVADVTLPDQPVAYVYSDIDGIYNLTLGSEKFEVNVENGVGTYQFSDLDVGQYSLIVSRVDDPVYKTTFNTTDFEVKKYLNTLTISTETPNPTYGDDVTITHAFDPTGPTGNIIYYVDGSTTGTELDVGQDFVLSGLGAGEHNVVAKYGGDGKYGESTSNTLLINVARAELNITIEDVTVNYPNKGTVKVNATVDGKYTIRVKDTDYEVNVIDGVGTFDVTETLAAGTYAITWNIAESENYTAASGSANYIVLHTQPDFSISGSSEINYNQSNTITPSINSDATGTISYSVNGSTPVSKGINEAFIAEGLDAGEYTVTATYSGDDNYESAVAEFNFTVVPIDIIINVENTEVVYPYTQFVGFTTSVPGTYIITINGKEYETTTDEDGTGVVYVTDVFGAGTYDISVSADLGKNYNPLDIPCAAYYIVTKAQSTINVTYEDGTYTVTLDGVRGEKLNETFHINVDTEDCDNGLTENGVFIFHDSDVEQYVELGPGKHNVLVIFDGNDNYTGSFAQTSFDIPKATNATVTITPTKESYAYGEDVYLDVTVKDGETGLNGSVTVSVDGIDYAITVTNGVGQAIVKGLSNGTFEAKAQFLGNDEYEPASASPANVVVNASTKITITASSEPVTYGENSFIEVNVTDGAGNPVAVEKVNVTIKGETKEYAVADGKVDLGALDADTYTAIVSYEDEVYEFASAPATVVVNPAVSELTLTPGEGTVTIAAKDKDGNALTGTATVLVDGVEAGTVEVAAEGTEYTINAAPGAHTVDVTFNKDNYAPSSGTVLVTVPKYTTELSIEADNVTPTFGTDVTVTATITEGATGSVTYYVDGAATGTEVAIGEIFVLSGLSAGEHNVTAKYAGDNNYGEATSNTVTINVAKAALEITVEDVTVSYPNKGTITVKANVDGKYTIKVNDKDYEVTVTDGQGSFDVADVLSAAEYPITWDIAETENYTAATGSAKYTVESIDPTFSISGTEEINYGQTNTIVPTINSDATGNIAYTINGEDAGSAPVGTNFVTDALPAGHYTVVANYAGDTNYKPAEAQFVFDVLPIDVVVTVENVEVIYPNTGVVNVTASVPGTYTITINGKEYEAVVGEDGKGSAQVTDVFGAGDYAIAVSANLGDNYKPVEIANAGTYSVGKANSTMAITYADGTCTVTLDGVNDEKLSESYHIVIDNVDKDDGATVNGVDTISVADLGPGKHSVFVIFDGNANYNGAYAQTSFDIPKKTDATVTITPTKESYAYGEDVYLNVTVKDGETGLTGSVTVSIDGIDYAITVTNGVGQAIVKGLSNGTFEAKAQFLGNDEYEPASASPANVVVNASTKITITASSEPVTYGENSFIEVNVTDGAGNPVAVEKVNVTIKGETKEYAVADGKVDLGALDADTYTAIVSYEDEVYEFASAPATVVVNPAVSDITVTAGDGNITIEAKDKDGNPISGTATVVIDGGEAKEVPIDETGKVEYVIDAAPGAHTVDVTFNKENYLPDSETVLVTVPKYTTELSIEADNVTPTFGTDVTVTATITEGATGSVTYYVDGAATGTEVAIGEIFVLSGLSAGEHNVTAKYAGDNNYGEATSNTVTITVAKAALEITVEDVTVTYPNKGTVTVKANVDGKYTIKVKDTDYEVNVIGGTGTFDVSEVLTAGTYAIAWDVAESENYTGATGSANYIVENTAPDFSISGTEEINYGQTNTITPTINSDATGTVSYKINGADAGSADVKEGFVTEALPAGHYTVVANYSGDTNYGEAIAEFEFDVLPIDVEVTVENVEVVYPNTGTVTVTASVPGTYTVTINRKDYEVTVGEEGTGSVAVTDVFDVGKYDISVTADLGDNYKPVSIGSAGTYTVTKAQSAMAITYADGTFTVTLDGVDEKLSENYHIILDNEAYGDDATVDGVDTFTIADLGPGKHGVFVIFDGNDNYLGTYAQTSVDIPKKTGAVVTVTAPDIKEGQNATITVTVKDGETGLTGVVTVTLDETDYALDVIDGTGTLIVQNLVSKDSPAVNNTTYAIVAKFNGNDEYEPATGEGSQLVQDWNPVIIVISSAGETAVATLVDTDLNNITGKVMVTIDDGEAKEYDCIDGKVTIDDITEGEHTVTVYFAGDDTHPDASETATVDIGKKLIPVHLLLTLADITYTQDAEAVVSLTATDDLGNTVKLNGTVKVTVGDQVKEVTVKDGEGKIKFSGLGANSYVAIAEFESDGTYDYAMVTAPLNVKQMKTRIIARNMTTTAINVTEDGRIGQYFSWTLVDEKGRVLADKAVSIGFNANVYNRVTNASGQARLQINLQNSGPYTFAISFLGDDNYEGCFEVVKIDVSKQKAQLTASGATYKASASTKTLSATYKTKAGKAIVGKTIKFTVNGKTYSAKTDSSGVAKVNVSLTKAGSYSVEVKAVETNTYAEQTKTITLKLT